ncbi:uncharacterized protein LOC123528323 isoform X2 [Mercenaria mercenaria]|uniref:uncharacterized protein LOC123528323 isoform X2 n=1 Tax=Mercenaria mercenaria TaxID=6596 RepID=UPI00234F98B4|nr:uncharacterized protein LOC123528323 isoform X2 [Mercenaria mercenaria]
MKRSIVIIIQIGLLSHCPTFYTTLMLFSSQWLIQSDGTNRGLINQQLKDSQTLDYNVDGFVMLAACVRFAAIFPMKKIGYAFYHNMAIFCFIWLVVLIFICDHICKRRRDENVFHTLVCGLREYNDDFTLL